MRHDPQNIIRRRRWYAAVAVMLALAGLEAGSGLLLWWHGSLPTGGHPLLRGFRQETIAPMHDGLMYDPHLLFRNQPGTTLKGLHIDEAGFIDNGTPLPDLAAPKTKTRVLLLGGSTVAGWGCSGNAATIPAFLARQLGPQYEVINAGVPGYVAWQELLYYLSDLQYLRPDIVIVYDGWNDYTHRCVIGGYLNDWQQRHARANFHQYGLYLQQVLPQMSPGQRSLINFAALRESCYTALLLEKVLRRCGLTGQGATLADANAVSRRPRVMPSPAAAAQAYVATVQSALRAMPQPGMRLIYALQPVIIHKAALTADEQRFAATQPLLPEYYAAARSGYRELMAANRQPAVQIVDLTDSAWVGVTETVYVDEAHLNDRGNEIIAGRLAQLISNTGD